MKSFRSIFFLLIALLFVLPACGPAPDQTKAEPVDVRKNLAGQSTLEDILKRGTIKVGFDTFKPWAMKDKNGKYIGFEIDVATKLAEDMGVKIQFVPTQWSGIIPALLGGKFDVIIGGMGITPKRNLKVNFTIPYEYSGMGIVANKSMAAGFTSLAEFNKPNVKIAVRLGTTAHKAVKNFLPKATIVAFQDESQTIQELLNERVYALVASNPLPTDLAGKYPAKLVLPLKDDFTKEPIAFAVRKSDYDFMNFLNNWIRVNFASGWLQNRYDYWFKTKEWEGLIE